MSRRVRVKGEVVSEGASKRIARQSTGRWEVRIMKMVRVRV